VNNTPEAPSASSPAEEIAVELSRLARRSAANGFDLLAYLIDMAVLEAWREASEGEDTAAERRGAPV
jgi:hypothetical protein